MASFSNRSSGTKTSRKVTGTQFAAGLGAFLLVSVLTGVLAAGLFVPVVGAMGAAAKAVPESFDDIPSELELVTPSEESRMLNSDGQVIATFYSARRIVVESDAISDNMKNAIIAIEDKRFYNHHGVDPDGLTRAFVNNLAGESTQGASTITQQYVKNMLVEKGIQEGDQDQIDEAQEESLERKLREARYAVALESKMSKEEILTGYLNVAPFGPTTYGVEAAAQAYFSSSAKDLSIGQAALLAGLVQSPVEYDPLIYPEAAQERRDIVLGEMLNQEYITQEEHDEAIAIPVGDMLKPQNRIQGCNGAGDAAYFCNYALADFLNDETFGENYTDRYHLLTTGGLTIRTTLNKDKQAAAQEAVTWRVPIGDESGLNTAIVSVEPRTGQVVAMAQNTNFSDDEVSFNADSEHNGGSGFQPGSAFKTFTLVEWFNEGRSAYESVGSNNREYGPYSFSCGGQPVYTGPWTVGDIDNKNGAYTVLKATQDSVNQAFASMASKIDYCQIFERAADLGVTQPDGSTISADNPSGIIGGSTTVTPLAMAQAYGAISNNGVLCEALSLTEVLDRDGNVLKTYEPSCKQAINQTVAQQVATVLKKTADSYTYSISRSFAAKTGTTDENSNTWVVGFTPQLATAAWTGTAENSSRPGNGLTINGEYWDYLYGGTFVGPMWARYMEAALDGTPAEDIPEVSIGTVPTPTQSTAASRSTTDGDNRNTNGDSDNNDSNNSNNSNNAQNHNDNSSEDSDD